MQLSFETFEDQSGAFCPSGEQFGALLEKFDDVLDRHQMGELSDNAYVKALEQLVASSPDFIDGYAHLAIHWEYQGKPKKALDMALKGLAVANRVIPEGFVGLIEWGHLDNRPYLRAMQAALISYIRLRRHVDAARMIELMLARNPNDNQGVRFLHGSELLRAKEHARARSVFEAEAHDYPPYYYELALSYIQDEDWPNAATALRKGFVSNPYIAEIFGGNSAPAPLPLWHPSNLMEAETAHSYIQMYGSLWFQNQNSIAFMRWLFAHPQVMMERAAIFSCLEELLWESNGDQRVKLGQRQRQLSAAIDDTLSTKIVIKRQRIRGKNDWPWLLV